MSEPDWKALPSLSALRAFDLTARRGSFSDAARALNVTHAAIAQQVRALEAELGVSLAGRAGRRIELTTAGHRLAARLSEGFEAIAGAVEDLRGAQAARPVTVATTMFISQSVILPRLHDFWKRHPDVAVSVLPSLDVMDMETLGLDLAIRAAYGEPDWPGQDALPLLSSSVLPVAAATLLEGGPTLDRLPWIWSAGATSEEDMLRGLGLDPARLRNADLGSPFLQLSAIHQGLGAAFVPEILVRQELATGSLRCLPMPEGFVPRRLGYFVVRPRGPMREQVSCFVDWLRDTVGEETEVTPAA